VIWNGLQLQSASVVAPCVRRKRSRYNPVAPVLLLPETIEAFVWDPALKETLIAGFRRMAGFYGFEIRAFADGSTQLDLPPEWVRPRHNVVSRSIL
jgi:hypothetical protein